VNTKSDYILHAQSRNFTGYGYPEHEPDHNHYYHAPEVCFHHEEGNLEGCIPGFCHDLRVDWDGTISVFLHTSNSAVKRLIIKKNVPPHLLHHIADIFTLVATHLEEQDRAEINKAVTPVLHAYWSLTPAQQAEFHSLLLHSEVP
jgi:hypothetical protein